MTRLLPRMAPLWALLTCTCVSATPAATDSARPPETPCDVYCDVLEKFGCEGDSPGKDGELGTCDDVPCVTVCQDVVTAGNYVTDVGCLGKAKSCEAAEDCAFGDE